MPWRKIFIRYYIYMMLWSRGHQPYARGRQVAREVDMSRQPAYF